MRPSRTGLPGRGRQGDCRRRGPFPVLVLHLLVVATLCSTVSSRSTPKGRAHFLPIGDSSLTSKETVSFDYHDVLARTWQGIKKTNIDPYEVKLVHRPRSETPNDAVSEGQGYGMLLALYTNDQAYFNLLLDNSERYMWNGRFHDWRVAENGTLMAEGFATDAEQDIALSLIFADSLVKQGIWQPHVTPKNVSYRQRAQEILNTYWADGDIIVDARYLAPAKGWGGRGFVNPGYFAPAWYRIFARFDKNTSHTWDTVIDQCYVSLEASVGADKGLVPDWMAPNGSFTKDGGYNSYDQGRSFFKDAIRIHWRLANDVLWFQEPRAKAFLNKAYTWLESVGGAPKANFFTMQGDVVPKTDFWEFDGGRRRRHRFEHSHLTVAMWATTAFGAGGRSAAEPYSQELLKFVDKGADYWGNKVDPTGGDEDVAHNELYFDSFLAWFGASMISGYWIDVTAVAVAP